MTDYTQEYIETLLAASHDPILILDGQYRIHSANAHFFELFGADRDRTLGQSLYDIAGGAWHTSAVSELLSRILPENNGAENYALELPLETDKSYKLLLNARQVIDPATGDHLIFLVIEDQSDSNATERRRQDSEDLFRVVADNAPVMIWLAGPDRQFYFFNRNWLHFTGRTIEQESGGAWMDNVHPDDRERCQNIFQSNFESRKEFSREYRLKRYDGKYRWVADKGVPRHDPDGLFTGYIGSCSDIHDQKDFTDALESMVKIRTAELEQSRSFLKAILNSTHYGIASYEPMRRDGKITDFTIVYTNPEVPGNFGLTVDDVIGKTCREVYPGIFKNGIFERMVKCIDTGQSDEYEVKVEQHGHAIWLTAAIERVLDTVTVTSKNITAEKEAALHLEHINEELNHKNKELASLTYIASHDLQEPLRKIQMFTSRILETDSNLSANSQSYFNSITSTAFRMQNLIDAVLSYSRMDSEKYKFERTNLNTLLKEVLQQMDLSLEEKGATIERAELPTLRIIPIHFQQLFLNILNNAVKYSKPDVKPYIKIEAEKRAEGKQQVWVISITDNGIGFDPQYKDKIFEAFQRLHGKMEYAGTGIGLAICQKIAQKHGGYIDANSKPGQGATFRIHLPIKD